MMRRTLHWYISALLLVLCLSGVSAAQDRTAAPPKPSISFTDIRPTTAVVLTGAPRCPAPSVACPRKTIV